MTGTVGVNKPNPRFERGHAKNSAPLKRNVERYQHKAFTLGEKNLTR